MFSIVWARLTLDMGFVSDFNSTYANGHSKDVYIKDIYYM